MEIKLVEKIQKVIAERWDKILSKYYQVKSSCFDDSYSDLTKSQSPSYYKKNTQDRLIFIIDTYCTLHRAREDNRISSREAFEKIWDILKFIEDKFTLFLAAAKDCLENFQEIEKDAISNQNIIQQTFKQIRFYEKDIQVINLGRKSEL